MLIPRQQSNRPCFLSKNKSQKYRTCFWCHLQYLLSLLNIIVLPLSDKNLGQYRRTDVPLLVSLRQSSPPSFTNLEWKAGFRRDWFFFSPQLETDQHTRQLNLALVLTFLNNELAFTPWEHDLHYNVVIRTCKFYIFVAKLFSNDFVGDFGWIFKLLQTNYRCGLQSSQTVGSALRTPWKMIERSSNVLFYLLADLIFP